MNRELALKVADAVLYEGYMLYPYRRSALKNRQHWTFGILYPPDYEEVRLGTERCSLHSECLLKAPDECNVDLQLRFLQLVRERNRDETEDSESQMWDESIARSVEFHVTLNSKPHRFPFCSAESDVVSTGRPLHGGVIISMETIADDLQKLTIDVMNETSFANGADRDTALFASLLSAHLILTANGGEFISLLDPPPKLRAHAGACKNVGNFPVLIGVEGEHDMMLCSPIILYDYPQVAPESAGDFFDATEMDEILTLRVMTLTDQEKEEIQSAGEHVRNLLERTERTAREQLMKTHGTTRGLG